jgi:hypothetical protein
MTREEADDFLEQARAYTTMSFSNPDLPVFVMVRGLIAEIERLRKENSDMGWEINPDRMGK